MDINSLRAQVSKAEPPQQYYQCGCNFRRPGLALQTILAAAISWTRPVRRGFRFSEVMLFKPLQKLVVRAVRRAPRSRSWIRAARPIFSNRDFPNAFNVICPVHSSRQK